MTNYFSSRRIDLQHISAVSNGVAKIRLAVPLDLVIATAAASLTAGVFSAVDNFHFPNIIDNDLNWSIRAEIVDNPSG